MSEPVFYDPYGRAYTVRDGQSVWLTEEEAAAAAAAAPATAAGAFWGRDAALVTADGVPIPAYEYVGWLPRAGARIIDLLITGAVSFVTGLLFGGLLAVLYHPLTGGDPQLLVQRVNQQTPLNIFLTFALGFVASTAFETIAEGMHGSTPGKMILGVTVRREDGSPCDYRAALVRSLAYFVDALFWGLVAFASMQGSPRKQRFGDKWAHTVVVRTSSLPEEMRQPSSKFWLATGAALIAYGALIVLSLVLKA